MFTTRLCLFALLVAPALANIALVESLDELKTKTPAELKELFKQGTMDKGRSHIHR